ncbi:MAG: folate-binding protein [Alphaproteobacteria bacterium]|nr:folate-binding protein [Alphaproteobacteria bacterium]
MSVRLEDRAIVALSGPEARSFLQGLTTNDVELLSVQKPLYAALLTPQGKILFDFFLFQQGDTVLLDAVSTQREALLKRLSLYRLRAKVDIAPRDDLAVIAGWPGSEWGQSDPRLAAMGSRAICALAEAPPANTAAYHDHRLALGVPEGNDFRQDHIFALDAGLDELHAISFTKGCYVGQELTARMKHRGTARKRLLPVEGTMLTRDGSIVGGDGKSIGEIEAVFGTRGFALVRLDRLAETAGQPLTANGQAVRVIRPTWLALAS